MWDFARGCMRTYLALAERARHFDSLPEVQEALAAASTPELGEATTSGAGEADALKAEADELDALGVRGYNNEALDQLAGRGPAGRALGRDEVGDERRVGEDPAQRRRRGAADGRLGAQLGDDDARRVPLRGEHARVELVLEPGDEPRRERRRSSRRRRRRAG